MSDLDDEIERIRAMIPAAATPEILTLRAAEAIFDTQLLLLKQQEKTNQLLKRLLAVWE